MRKSFFAAPLFLTLAASIASGAIAGPLTPADLEGTWRMSAVASNKYGCDMPGAMTVVFRRDANGGLTGVYSGPGLTGSFEQSFEAAATMQTVLLEQSAGGRAIVLEAPKSLRRILAMETAAGADGRPQQISWASVFGGFGEEASPFDDFVPSAWLTRCGP
jgi:hypothetical protein